MTNNALYKDKAKHLANVTAGCKSDDQSMTIHYISSPKRHELKQRDGAKLFDLSTKSKYFQFAKYQTILITDVNSDVNCVKKSKTIMI